MRALGIRMGQLWDWYSAKRLRSPFSAYSSVPLRAISWRTILPTSLTRAAVQLATLVTLVLVGMALSVSLAASSLRRLNLSSSCSRNRDELERLYPVFRNRRLD